MIALCWIVLAYLIGAAPSGYIIGKAFYGIDLRTRGSGNIGATNAYRELGLKAAAAVFICDFLKGVLAVWIGGSTPLLALACATAAIVGNDWSVFLHFKSGKGVACGVGAFTFICPWATLSAVVVLVIYLAHMPMEYVIFSALAAAIIIGKHHSNIRRLLAGEEKKITRDK